MHRSERVLSFYKSNTTQQYYKRQCCYTPHFSASFSGSSPKALLALCDHTLDRLPTKEIFPQISAPDFCKEELGNSAAAIQPLTTRMMSLAPKQGMRPETFANLRHDTYTPATSHYVLWHERRHRDMRSTRPPQVKKADPGDCAPESVPPCLIWDAQVKVDSTRQRSLPCPETSN